MSTFTAAQRAELSDAAARARLEYARERDQRAKEWAENRRQERAELRALNPPKPRKRRPRKTLPTKSEPMFKPTREEETIAERLIPHIATDSVIDRRRHALGVARMIVQGRRR